MIQVGSASRVSYDHKWLGSPLSDGRMIVHTRPVSMRVIGLANLSNYALRARI